MLPADLTLLYLHENELTISKQHKEYHDRVYYNTRDYYYDDYGYEDDEYGGEDDYGEEHNEENEDQRPQN